MWHTSHIIHHTSHTPVTSHPSHSPQQHQPKICDDSGSSALMEAPWTRWYERWRNPHWHKTLDTKDRTGWKWLLLAWARQLIAEHHRMAINRVLLQITQVLWITWCTWHWSIVLTIGVPIRVSWRIPMHSMPRETALLSNIHPHRDYIDKIGLNLQWRLAPI